jgi:hypothetical protein
MADVPYGENKYIYGLHDPGGENLLKEGATAKGWVLITEEIRANPNDQGGTGRNYKGLADQGFGVIVRLNHAYGPDGTIPPEAKYPDFAQRAANFVRNSPGAHIWIIGNEMNFEREQPRLPDGSGRAEPIIPRRYAECYKLVRRAIKGLSGHENDQVVVGAMGPWNGQTPYEADPQGKYSANKIPNGPGEYPYNGFFGDYILYLRDLLLAIGRENCDAIAIHAYSHGFNPALVFSDEKMGPPFQKYNYHFRTYRDQMNIIPPAFHDLPVYLTEANGDVDPNGVKWPDVNSSWVKNAYKEINDWNAAGNQQIRCVILYRWSRDDDWSIADKGQVQQDLREAMARNYTWNPDVKIARPKPEPKPISEPAVPGYRTRYIGHNTPATLTAGQSLTVNIALENAGSFTWLAGGQNPFRLGFQWYNAAGQTVQLPPEQDYRTPLPNNVPPGGRVSLQGRLRVPDAAGVYQLRWDMVHEMVTWFTSQGDAGLLVSPVTVNPAAVVTPPTAAQLQIQDVSRQLTTHPTLRYVARDVAAIKRVIIHHSGTPPTVTVQRIAEFQVQNKGLPGITYHFCTTDQGAAYQTQPLTVTAAHAGQDSKDSVGICLIGNFMQTPPPQAQLNATASALAQLLAVLKLTTAQVFGYSELINTQSPGATWPAWKGPLLQLTNQLMTTAPQPPTTPAQKPIYHTLLFWYRGPGNWAEWDLRGAFDYIDAFHPAVVFSVDEAKTAQYVTIVGGPGGVSTADETALKAAGCQVERIAGANETETRRMLNQMAAQNQRFSTLK